MIKFFFIIIILLGSCTKSESKPILTLEQFDQQAAEISGVLLKLINDEDANRVHIVALGLESTFAVDCKAIGEECAEYHNILTAIIQKTSNKSFSEANKEEIKKKQQALEEIFKTSRIKLISEWNNSR